MCGSRSDRILPYKTKEVASGEPLQVVHLLRLPVPIHRTQKSAGLRPLGVQLPLPAPTQKPRGTRVQSTLQAQKIEAGMKARIGLGDALVTGKRRNQAQLWLLVIRRYRPPATRVRPIAGSVYRRQNAPPRRRHSLLMVTIPGVRFLHNA